MSPTTSELKEHIDRQTATDELDPAARQALRDAVRRLEALGWWQIHIENEVDEIVDGYSFTHPPR